MKNNVKILFVILLMLAVVTPSMAQIGLPEEPGDTPAPIDGFVGIAIAIGAVVGARRLRSKEN